MGVPLGWNSTSNDYKTYFSLDPLVDIELPSNYRSIVPTWTVEWEWGQKANQEAAFGLAGRAFSNTLTGRTLLTVVIDVTDANDNVISFQKRWRATAFGGPIIGASQVKQDEEAFVFHRDANSETAGDNWVFPWFIYDFDYNPFQYRTASSSQFHPDNIQPSSVVRFESLLPQPADATCQGSVNGNGVVLLLNPQLESVNGQVNPKRSIWLVPGTVIPVGFDGSTGNGNEEFAFSFTYKFSPEGIAPVYASDFSPDYWAHYWSAHPAQQLAGNPQDFLKFRTHRPAQTVAAGQPPVLSPPIPDPPMTNPEQVVGNWFVYQLVDQSGLGLPGVWVQERFWLDSVGNFQINEKPWTTQRKGYEVNEGLPADSFLDGHFDHPDFLRIPKAFVPLTPTIDGHEYWAGTKWSARTFSEYRTHFDATLNRLVWDGVWINAFKIIIPTDNWQDTQHTQGTRSPLLPGGTP